MYIGISELKYFYKMNFLPKWSTLFLFVGCVVFSLDSSDAIGSAVDFSEFDTAPLIVETNYGALNGFISYSRGGREFREFLGIPYAQAPLGDLRYRDPLPSQKWVGVKEATAYGPKCLQFDMFTDLIVGDEDCLFLNVFTPKVHQRKTGDEEKNLLPVIFFVHGGLFMYGGSDEYRPEYFMDEDVVVVTTNYRLNSFGFLNTGDEVVRGNMGLKDQTMALKWVQENIKYFGGDPNNVALTGQSAGGASVHLHLLSPMSKGLFHRAISVSGNAMSNWAFIKTTKLQARRYGERLNCSTDTSVELVSCLRSIEAKVIVSSHSEIQDFLNERMSHFAPSQEAVNDSNTFLFDTPENIIRSGKIASKVPWITGVNSEDGLIFVIGLLFDQPSVSRLNRHWRTYAPKLFEYDDLPIDKRDEISEKIKTEYLRGEEINENMIQSAMRLFTDANFNHALHTSAVLQSKHHPVYLYYYSHQGSFGFYQVFHAMTKAVPKLLDWVWALGFRWLNYDVLGRVEEHFGACHGDENVFIWKMPLISNFNEGSEDYYFSKSLVHLWSSFAKSGKPKLEGVAWSPVNFVIAEEHSLDYLRLANHTEIIPEPFEESLKFWTTEIAEPIRQTRLLRNN